MNIISVSNKCIGGLDDDYTLYDNGEVLLHEFDRNIYSSGLNHSEILRAEDLSKEIKSRIFNDTIGVTNKEIAKVLLGLS
ncbi:hypothetical protein [Algoriphagus sp.]|uniref:hypothetical protein n=1 Tax=Algoriphagus sp. TaxID=1872435 RepID=UPI002724F0AF|nr:hypothetical protein [Algoriphagus sp.]MDO8965072.1 hypothetical protein [Algoriphagus sp.]MDP3199146.1 hypothetical protein [Algoriphagus sp.]